MERRVVELGGLVECVAERRGLIAALSDPKPIISDSLTSG